MIITIMILYRKICYDFDNNNASNDSKNNNNNNYSNNIMTLKGAVCAGQ